MAMVIGLTGGIASGKSTVANMLKAKGYSVIDADVEARLAVEPGEPAYAAIIAAFGEEILQEDKSIDRQKLGAIIFHDEEKRHILNGIVHPAIRERMAEKQRNAENGKAKLVVLDIPLLFENKLTTIVEKTLLVYVDEATQIDRLMKRNNLSRDEALARINSQLPLEEKRQLADETIDNSSTIEATEGQLQAILEGWGMTEK